MHRSLFALLLLPAVALADDWPQWMGPKRDNVWRETGVLDTLPKEPKVVWRTPVAGGYAGPAVSGGRVYFGDYVSAANVKVDNFDRKTFSGTERFLCLDEASGKILWKHEYPVKYTISYPAGPRCTPIVAGGKVYALGAEGHLFCFTTDGSIVWQKHLPAEYQAKTPLWGYAAHPLLDGQKLITLAGGAGSHVVALDKDTGKEIWRALTSEEQGYAPPTIIEAGGQRQLLLLRPDAVSAVDPETGKELWTTPYDATNGSIIMSPIVWNEYLFVAGYSDKNLLLKLAKDKPGAEVVWRNERRKAVSPVNVQPTRRDNVVYGFDQNGEFMAVELPSGKRLWTTTAPVSPPGSRPGPSATAFIYRHGDAGERYWFFTDQGDLTTGKLTPQGYEETSRTHVIEKSNNAFGRSVVWCPPAFANKRMYVRNDNECVCVDLSK